MLDVCSFVFVIPLFIQTKGNAKKTKGAEWQGMRLVLARLGDTLRDGKLR
jgi:hypothetical protein